MKKVVSKQKSDIIDLDVLIERLTNGEELIVTYKAKSEQPYYTYLSMTSHGQYGFRSPYGLKNKMTYLTPKLEDTLVNAIKGGKELLVFERNETSDLFKML